MDPVVENLTMGGFFAVNETADQASFEYVRMVGLVTAIVVPIVFGAIFVVGVIGNLLLVFTVSRNRTMRTNPNVFLVSLSVGDVLLLLISVPFTATIYTIHEWNYGDAVCKVNVFMQSLSLGVSIFTLTAVSGDRFVAVVFPIASYKWSTMRRTLQICAVLWAASVALAVPDLFFANVGFYRNTDRRFLVCNFYPADWSKWYIQLRVTLRFAVYFVLPLLIISTMYVMIAVTLLRKPLEPCPSGTNATSAAWTKQLRARRRISKMVLCIVVIFAVCWLPRYVYLLWHDYYGIDYNTVFHVFKIAGFCLSFAYSSVNPVALYVVSDDFRQYFDHYLFGRCCRSRRMKKRRGTTTMTGFPAHSVASNGGRLLQGSHTRLSMTPGNTPNLSLEDITRA